MTTASIASARESKSTEFTTNTDKKSETREASNLFSAPRGQIKFKARSSIPSRMEPSVYARQCNAAALASRLDPYALHPDEHRLLREKLCHLHVTVYLNIRNGILRLWIRNPSVGVSLEEAIGCAKDDRWTQLACFAFEWLMRKSYINHGCVDVNNVAGLPPSHKRRPSTTETVVVIGAGMAGLSCARQLTNLYKQSSLNRRVQVIILEGRSRVGGRIYSHPLTCMSSSLLEPHQRPTAEMGAQIITGFENGNPLDAIVRGQLALRYHSLRDVSTLYDIDGSAVEENQDTMVNKLYDDIINRSDRFFTRRPALTTARGDKDLIDSSRDPNHDDGVTIAQYEEAEASGTVDTLLPSKSKRRGVGHKAAKADNSTEETETNMDTQIHLPAARVAKQIGFAVRPGTSPDESLDFEELASVPNQTLGTILDAGVEQYSKILDLKPKALRLLNWHYANAEYSNAANVAKLNLKEYAQDTGNEFSGDHAQVIGGYQQVPRAIWRYPDKLDVRTNDAVIAINYSSESPLGQASVKCESGQVYEADRVVFAAPLGVLKAKTITFVPPLPRRKEDSISRLGFGLLNKVILVFQQPFWEANKDFFGMLRGPRTGLGLKQDDYVAGRGQFWLTWNCLPTSGLPVLIALMAGDAAFEAEDTSDKVLIDECLSQLRNCFGAKEVTDPIETIVTRWGSDKFARGTYSFVGATSKAEDYDILAEPAGNLFFAGEATCRSHPATVHGAYLSGLRCASDVLDSLVGPVRVPASVNPAVIKAATSTPTQYNAPVVDTSAPRRKGDPILPSGTFTRPIKEKFTAEHDAWDAALWIRIYDDIGNPPMKPEKKGINPFLLFQKDHWDEVKEQIETTKTQNKRKDPKAGRDEIRVELGKLWRTLGTIGQESFSEQVRQNKEENSKNEKDWITKTAEWNQKTYEIRDTWISEGNSFEEFCRRKREEEQSDLDSRTSKRLKQ